MNSSGFRGRIASVTKNIWVILAIAVILGGFFLAKPDRAPQDFFRVERGSVKEELILTGSIKAEKHSLLAFPTSGKIAWVGVSEGQRVYRGQGLASLDKTVLNATYQQVLNTYKDKQAGAEKVEDDVKDHAGDETFAQKATRTTAQVARDSAYDAVLAAEYNLKNATLTAPFTGIISSLPFTSPGVNISVADAIVEIVDPATIYFEVDADQSEVINVKEGQEVIVVLDSYSDEEFRGKVAFVAYTPKAGEAGTIYKIKVNFDKETLGEIFPRIGMTGDAKFTLSQKDSVLFVPSEFVNSDIKGKYLKVRNPKNKTYVDVGLVGEERTEVISDKFKEGDVVYD